MILDHIKIEVTLDSKHHDGMNGAIKVTLESKHQAGKNEEPSMGRIGITLLRMGRIPTENPT